jgi:hypothetical protein
MIFEFASESAPEAASVPGLAPGAQPIAIPAKANANPNFNPLPLFRIFRLILYPLEKVCSLKPAIVKSNPELSSNNKFKMPRIRILYTGCELSKVGK